MSLKTQKSGLKIVQKCAENDQNLIVFDQKSTVFERASIMHPVNEAEINLAKATLKAEALRHKAAKLIAKAELALMEAKANTPKPRKQYKSQAEQAEEAYIEANPDSTDMDTMIVKPRSAEDNGQYPAMPDFIKRDFPC